MVEAVYKINLHMNENSGPALNCNKQLIHLKLAVSALLLSFAMW